MLGIKGVIFDFDGVIIDSESRWPALENPYIRQHTKGWSDDFYSNLTGMGLDEVYEYLASHYTLDVSREQYFADYEQLALILYGEVALPVEGMSELLRFLKSKGVRMSIASSSKADWIIISLKRHGMDEYFESITSSHDDGIIHGKPAPDVYLSALAKQHLATNEVMVVEDSTNGIIAAKSAGLFCVGVNIGNTNTQDISYADLKIDKYSELAKLFN